MEGTDRAGTSPAAGQPGLRSAEAAAVLLRSWLADGVLERDDREALWLYEIQPADGGPSTVGWLGAVAIPPPGSSAVLPHEDTYAPAVEGRRALLAATGTDLEPIVLAHDPEQTIAQLTEQAAQGTPTLQLWDAQTARPLGTGRKVRGGLQAVAPGPDGRTALLLSRSIRVTVTCHPAARTVDLASRFSQGIAGAALGPVRRSYTPLALGRIAWTLFGSMALAATAIIL